MKKFKNLIFLLLAINVFALADNEVSSKQLEKIYKNVTENKNTDKNFEIVNDLLSKRNKELKDLRLQSDYIITPEYLEWQIFFTGFYNHSNRNSKNSTVPYVLSEESTIKSINLGKTITVREVNDISLNPEININSKVVAEAPHIVIPNIGLPSLNVTAPSLSVNPNVVSPNINVNTNISIPTAVLSPITVVSFGLPYFASDNASLSHVFNSQPVAGYSQNLTSGGIQESIITLYGWGNPITYIENNGGTLTVSKQNSRAMEVDEPINSRLHIANKGNIILNESMTVGMEARGAQLINTADITNHNSYISNEGTIIGNAGFRNQAGLSVGADGSVTGTLIHMKNTGTIIMNSPESIGIINDDYMNKFEENTFYSILGGGGGASDYYQMMTYYEMITLNANQLKQFNNDLEQMRVYLEQIKKLPEDLIIQELAKHSGMVQELLEIQNTTKDVLKSARGFEDYYKQTYSDIKNGNYINLLDRYATTLNDLTYEAMRSSNMSAEASKNAGQNAKYLLEQTKTAQNPTQVLEVLSKWNSNLSYQLNAISELINNSNRLQILEKQKEASRIQIEREQQEKAKLLLEQQYKKLKQNARNSKGAW